MGIPMRAGDQVFPPSVETSTDCDFPAPSPCQACDIVKARAGQLHVAGWEGDDRFGLHVHAEHGAPCHFQRSVYLEVSSRVINGLSLISKRRSHLICVLPSQPGSRRRRGIALFRPNRLAVLPVDNKAVLQHFLERDAARHDGGVRAFGQHPGRPSFNPISRAKVAN